MKDKPDWYAYRHADQIIKERGLKPSDVIVQCNSTLDKQGAIK